MTKNRNIGDILDQQTTFAVGIQVNANVLLSNTDLKIGNTTANLFANSILLAVANASGQVNVQPTQIVVGSVTYGATSIAVGANVLLDTVKLPVRNSTANLHANSVLVTVANSTGTANLQPTQLVIGGS